MKEETNLNSPLEKLLDLLNNVGEVDVTKNEERPIPDRRGIIGKHYDNLELDAWDIMEANASKEEALGFIKYNIIKYTLRDKGEDISDFSKIINYAKLGKEWTIK